MNCRLWSRVNLHQFTLRTQSFRCSQFNELKELKSFMQWAAVAVMVVVYGSSASYAEIDSAAIDEYFEFLARANDYSPLEHGGSHGTIGFGVGLGLAGYDAPANSDVMKEHWRGSNPSVDQSQSVPVNKVIIPRFQFHKGLPASIDFGVGIGMDALSRATLASGYAQWTMYEAFAMPAFAVRGGYNRVMGLATTDASSTTVDGVASYGFLRIFTVYGTMGAGRHQIEVRSGAGYGSVMALNGEYEGVVSRVLLRRSRSTGLKLQIIPALCDLSFESKRTGDGPGTYLAKISLGM